VVLLGFLCGLAELLLCIHHVYLGAPYAFLMKFLLIKKKKGGVSDSKICVWYDLFTKSMSIKNQEPRESILIGKLITVVVGYLTWKTRLSLLFSAKLMGH